MGEWKKTQCHFCAVSCGLEMEIEDNKIINVRPDPDSPRSKGYCCRKGRSAKYYQDHGDRLDYPLKKVGDHFERISWEQAIEEIGAKARKILADHGPKSLAVIGGPLGAAQEELVFARPFANGVGSPYTYNPIGFEFMGNWWSHGKIFGDQMHFTEPDDVNCEIMIYWGSNSYVAHNVLNSRLHIREASQDPNRMFIVVDPRMSETARMADMHIMPRPGSDSLLLRGLISLILEKGWQNKEYIEAHVADFGRILPWFRGFNYKEAFRVCGVPYEQMEKFARLLTTKKWGLHHDLGLFCNRHSTTNSYLVLMLQVLCGVSFVEGGCITNECWAKRGKNIDESDPNVPRTVVTNSFPVLGTYPECALPDEVLSDNPDRLRMIFCTTSNPARSWPDSAKMAESFKALELFVVIDVTMTETAELADYVLPAKNGYEAYSFNVFQLNYPEIVAQLRHPIISQIGERKEGAEIWLMLSKAIGSLPPLPESLYKAGKKAAETGDRIPYFLKILLYAVKHKELMPVLPSIIGETLGTAMGSPTRAAMWAALMTSPLIGTGQVELADIPSLGKHPILEKLPKFKDFCLMDAAFQLVDDHPEGAVIGMTRKDTMLERHIAHPDHKIHLYCDEINDYINNLTPEKEEAALTLKDGNNMVVSSGRHSDDGHNGVMRNPATYVWRNPYTLALNPADAQRLNLHDGQMARITAKGGTIDVPVEISYQMGVGYGMVPHHFGFKFEGKTVGHGVNEFTSYHDHDTLTGNPTVRYVPCRVEAAEAVKEG
ncbi:MAG: molybdopterin-dependent oxidoreductase [Oscillospiraceae bacterium]